MITAPLQKEKTSESPSAASCELDHPYAHRVFSGRIGLYISLLYFLHCRSRDGFSAHAIVDALAGVLTDPGHTRAELEDCGLWHGWGSMVVDARLSDAVRFVNW